jgi:hypothetical protein
MYWQVRKFSTTPNTPRVLEGQIVRQVAFALVKIIEDAKGYHSRTSYNSAAKMAVWWRTFKHFLTTPH